MPQKKITKPLTQAQIDSYDRVADSLYAQIIASQKKTEEFRKWQDSMATVENPVVFKEEKGWYMDAQNYMVPALAAILIMILIFGILALVDSKKGHKENKRDRILSFIKDDK